MRLPTPPTKRPTSRSPSLIPALKPAKPNPAPVHFTVARPQPRFELFKASFDFDDDQFDVFDSSQPRRDESARATRSVLFDPIRVAESAGAVRFDSVLTDAGHEEDIKGGLGDTAGGDAEDTSGGYSELDNGVYKKRKKNMKNVAMKKRSGIEEQFTGASIVELIEENLVNGKMFEGGNRVLYFCGEEERWRDTSLVVRMTEPFSFTKTVEINLQTRVGGFVPNSKRHLGYVVAQAYLRFWKEIGHHERWLHDVYLFQLKQLRDGTWEAVMGATSTLWDAVYHGGLGESWKEERVDVDEEMKGWVYHP